MSTKMDEEHWRAYAFGVSRLLASTRAQPEEDRLFYALDWS
jgi:hypothetical protein